MPKRRTNGFTDLVVEPIPHSGPVRIVRENLDKHFGNNMIAQYGGEFTMFRQSKAGRPLFRVRLTPDDAAFILGKFRLVPVPSPTFARSMTWMHYEDAEKIRNAG